MNGVNKVDDGGQICFLALFECLLEEQKSLRDFKAVFFSELLSHL